MLSYNKLLFGSIYSPKTRHYSSSTPKKIGGVLIKKALHIVTDATHLIYGPFRTLDFILMVRDLLLEDY